MAVSAPAARVSFAAAARPEEGTHVAVGAFEGPLALLLGLIESRELDVLSVSLGDLAGAYLEALGDLTGDRLRHLSAFISVAAQLILIKSRALLPRPPEPAAGREQEPDPETELRERLILYRIHRDAAQQLAARLETGLRLHRREAAAALAAGRAGVSGYVARPLDPELLPAALAGLIAIAPLPEPEPQLVRRMITLAERTAVIREALRNAPAVVLQDLLEGTRDRVLAAVTFLALLELVKQREVEVEQLIPWGPIECRLVTGQAAS